MVSHVTTAPAAPLERLPSWVTLVRAPNPGPMTLDGTNTWLLRAPGSDAAVVIDPGPLIEEHLADVAGRGPVGAVLTTHSHPDHVEGLDRFVELTRASRTQPAEVSGVALELVRTPGHTADSVCFLAQ